MGGQLTCCICGSLFAGPTPQIHTEKRASTAVSFFNPRIAEVSDTRAQVLGIRAQAESAQLDRETALP